MPNLVSFTLRPCSGISFHLFINELPKNRVGWRSCALHSVASLCCLLLSLEVQFILQWHHTCTPVSAAMWDLCVCSPPSTVHNPKQRKGLFPCETSSCHHVFLINSRCCNPPCKVFHCIPICIRECCYTENHLRIGQRVQMVF